MNGLVDLFNNGGFSIIECSNQNEFFSKISKDFLDNNLVEPSFCEAIVKREKEFPTGLETSTYNVALNHVDSEHVKTNALFIYKLKKPISYHKMDNPDETIDVDIVFVLLIKDHDLQVKAISAACKFWLNENAMKELYKAQNKEAILTLLKELS